jgi:pyruvate/2-oxoglutarate dehydrogenase complex dihydrolipoamide dehydrogenase (E3) component
LSDGLNCSKLTRVADTIARLGFLPASVVITGAGIIAIEFAKIFTKLGAQVAVLRLQTVLRYKSL